jgi:hypothetical protein
MVCRSCSETGEMKPTSPQQWGCGDVSIRRKEIVFPATYVARSIYVHVLYVVQVSTSSCSGAGRSCEIACSCTYVRTWCRVNLFNYCLGVFRPVRSFFFLVSDAFLFYFIFYFYFCF